MNAGAPSFTIVPAFARHVDESDDIINPLGIKRLVGGAAASADAVHHATGKRVRDLPITLDKLTR